MGACLLPGEAAAFCRTTTCSKADCPVDEKGCKTTGVPIWWGSSCVGFSMNADGSEFIDMSEIRVRTQDSFAAWTGLSCVTGEGTSEANELPSLEFALQQDVTCHRTEYNESAGNANIILFQDRRWDYDSVDNTLAKTTVSYDSTTGEIFDADIEVNSAFNEFTVSEDPSETVYDYQSIMTHEIGHFIGFDHTQDPEATMNPGYQKGSALQRDLAADDIEGLCTAYTPGRAAQCATTPRNGFAVKCGDGTNGWPITADPKPPIGKACAIRPPEADLRSARIVLSAIALFGMLAGRRVKRMPARDVRSNDSVNPSKTRVRGDGT